MEDFLTDYGYLSLFLVLLLENTVVLGVLFPGVTATISAGYFANAGYLEPGPVYLTAWSAVLLGDLMGYLLGRLGLPKLRIVRRLIQRHERKVQRLQHHTPLAMLLFQFPMPTRAAVPVLAGALRVPIRRWVLLDIAATTIFTTTLVSIGYFIGGAAGSLDEARTWGVRVQVLFVAIFVGWVTIQARRIIRKRGASRRERVAGSRALSGDPAGERGETDRPHLPGAAPHADERPAGTT